MSTFKNVRENEKAVDLDVKSVKNSGTTAGGPKSLINDGINKNREDSKQLGNLAKSSGQQIQPRDTTAASVSDSASAEYNSFNHLKHLKPVCTYKVDYFITPGILTHAASVLRKAAFGDVSEIIKNLNEKAKRVRAQALELLKNKVAKSIETGENTVSEVTNIDIPAEEIQYDLLNIPWNLRVPSDSEKAIALIGGIADQGMDQIEQSIASSGVVKDVNPSFTIKIETGRDADACPKSVTHKGFKYVGSFIKPLYIPIHPASSYGGMFGKMLSQIKAAGTSPKLVNSVGALIVNRICVPTKFNEPEGSLPIVASLFSDYASIVSPPIVYGSDSISYNDNTEIKLDDEWKKLMVTGSLFTTETGDQYSSTGLSKDDVVKHGTDGLKKTDLTDTLGSKRTKMTTPFLRRLALDESANKAGNAPVKYEKDKAKDYSKLNNSSVADTLAGISWNQAVSNRYSRSFGVDSIKLGRNFYDITDIPAFNFWSPWITSKAEDTDGSTIYSYLDPENDKSLSSIKVIYTPKAPVAVLEAGVTYTPFDIHVSNVDDTDINPGVFVDNNIQKYGIGGFGSTTDTKDTYLLPVSNLTKKIFTSVTSLVSDPEFPVTHKYGKKSISLHSAILRNLARTFTSYSNEAVNSIKDVVSFSLLQSKYKGKKGAPLLSDSGELTPTVKVTIGLSDIVLFGTSFETSKPDDETLVFVDENQKNLIGPDVDKTYNKGKIGKVVKVDINNIKNADIYIGKTFNAKGIEDNVKLTSSNVKKFLVDSPILSTPITEITAGQKSILTDIQPGEEITRKVANDATETPVKKPATILNEVEYGTSFGMAKSALYTEDLIDSNSTNRVGVLDIISSLMGSGYSDSQSNDLSSGDSKPVTKDIDTLLNTALQQAYTSLVGKTPSIPGINNLWKSKGSNLIDTPTGGDPYTYFSGIPEKQGGIFSAMSFLLCNPEIFYLEHFEDVKKDPEARNSLLFYEAKYPDESGGYGVTYNLEETLKYLDLSGPAAVAVQPTGYTLTSKPEDFIYEKIKAESVKGFSTYSAWTGFESGIESYDKRFDKFSPLSKVDNEKIRKKDDILFKIDSLVSEILSFMKGRRTVVSSFIIKIFTTGEFALTNSNAVSVFTSLFAYGKLKEISKSHPGTLDTITDIVFDSIGAKITSSALYSAAEHLGKANEATDDALSKIVKIISDNKAQLIPLVSAKQTVSDDVLNSLLSKPIPKTIAALLPLVTEDKLWVLKILIYGIACFYFKTVVYGKGFPDDSSSVEPIKKLLLAITNTYKVSTGDTSGLVKVPRYDVVDLDPLADLILEVMKSSKEPKDFRALTDLYKKMRLLFTSWYAETEDRSFEFNVTDNGIGGGKTGTPYIDFSIPKNMNISIPICIVSEVDSEEVNSDIFVYQLVDQSSGISLSDFANAIKEKKYQLLRKNVDIKWLDSGFLSGDLDLARVSLSIRHAATIVNLIDYTGFLLQSMYEVNKTREMLGPSTVVPDPLSGRALNRTIRRKKIELGSEYVQDDSSDLTGVGTRRYIVKLNDYSNLVNIKENFGLPKITKMFPLGLKDLDPDKQDISLAEKDLVESKNINLTNITSGKTKYFGTFLRPGYGLPDLAEKVGYRCKIDEVSSVLYGKFKPKRYAFLGLFKEGEASLKLSRMIQSASGDRFKDLIKSSDWTSSRLLEKETDLKSQLTSFTLANKYKSSYDGFVPKGMKGTILFDIEIGYISTRPLFISAVQLRIPPIAFTLSFGGIIDKISLKYKNSYPVNMVGRLLSGTAGTPPAKVVNKAKAKKKSSSLFDQFKNILDANRDSSGTNKIPNLKTSIDNFNMLSSFRIPQQMAASDFSSLESLVTKALEDSTKYNDLKAKIVELCSAKKLRDSTFDPSSQFCFNGRVFENTISGASTYPVFYPGSHNLAKLKTPQFQDYTSIKNSGISNESLYDLHPLSFLTSPTFIGLSKRRSLVTGALVLSQFISGQNGIKFIPKPNAVNPYAGIYYKVTGITHNDIATANSRQFPEGREVKSLRFAIVPDFPSDIQSLSSIFKNELSGLGDADISNNNLAEFFGTGVLLNGKFTQPDKSTERPQNFFRNNPKDALEKTSHDYSKEALMTILDNLKMWYEYAKKQNVESDFYYALNGCLFTKPAAGVSGNSAKINNPFVYKHEIKFNTEKDKSDLTAAIVSVFATQALVPIALEGNTLYYTGSAISYITLLLKTKPLKSPSAADNRAMILKYIDQQKDTNISKIIEHFKSVDLYSIMVGGRFNPGEGSAIQEEQSYSGFLGYKNIKATLYKEDSINFVSAQSYMGYSNDSNNKPVPFAITDSAIGGLKFLSPTRTFGKDLKIKDIITNGFAFSYMQMQPVAKQKTDKNSKSNKTGKLIQMAAPIPNTEPLLYKTHALNIFAMTRLWLAYNWYGTQFSSNTMLMSGEENLVNISDATLRNLTFVDTAYFVKNTGKILKNAFEKKQTSFSLLDISSTSAGLNPVYQIGGSSKIVASMYKGGPANPPDIKKANIGIAGVIQTGTIPATELTTKGLTSNPETDLSMDRDSMAALWSLLAMKVFVGTENIGIEIKAPDIINDVVGIKNAPGAPKPTLGAIDNTKSKVYTDILSWNRTGIGTDRFVTKLRPQGDKWGYISSTEAFSEFNIDTTVLVTEKQSAKIMAAKDGLLLTKLSSK